MPLLRGELREARGVSANRKLNGRFEAPQNNTVDQSFKSVDGLLIVAVLP